MKAGKALSFVLATMLISALPSIARADYVWSGVTPTDGGNGSGTTQNVGAIVKWGTSDAAPTGYGVTVTVAGGYSGTTTNNITFNNGSGQATFSGSVSFDPPLPSGTKYTITFGLNFSGPPYMEATSTTVTVP